MPAIPRFKLIYFNGRGRAETIRLLFAQAKANYEDVRVEKEDWPELKKSMPYGQLPVLEMNGQMLAQSHAIEKLLARMFGLNGNDDWESAKIDELIYGMEDFIQKIVPALKEQDQEKKREALNKLFDDEIAPFLHRYEQFLLKNGSGYFVGKELSLADLSIFNMISFFDEKIMPGQLNKFPALDEFAKKIGELPNIKEWIEKRPKTDY